MNFFSMLVNWNSSVKRKKWIETSGTFTGKKERAATRTKIGFKEQDYFEYELRFYVDDMEKCVWYSFYPLPDPDEELLAGMEVRIRYNRRKPYLFEVIDNTDYSELEELALANSETTEGDYDF